VRGYEVAVYVVRGRRLGGESLKADLPAALRFVDGTGTRDDFRMLAWEAIAVAVGDEVVVRVVRRR